MNMLWAAIGVLVGLAGLSLGVRLRFGRKHARVRVPLVGELSRVTLLIVSLALIGAGYHVFVYATNLMREFRAPLGWALGVAGVAIVASVAIDALENRLLGEEGPARENGGGHDGGGDGA